MRQFAIVPRIGVSVPIWHGLACHPSDKLPCDIVDHGRDFRLVATADIYFTVPGITNEWFVIPEGSKCDSVSTGRFFGRVILGRGKNARAGLIHDWLYSLDAPFWITRKTADIILRRAIRYGGAAAWRAWAAYFAVRLCGWVFFRKARMPRRKAA